MTAIAVVPSKFTSKGGTMNRQGFVRGWLRRQRECSLMACTAVAGFLAAFGGNAAAGVPVQGRVSTTQKGSLLIFPDVEIKWDDAGNVLQDTVIDLTNDYAGQVYVQLYFINGDAPLEETFVGFPVMRMDEAEPGWNWADCRLPLTSDQPVFWSALTGEPRGCQPFSVLDPPALYGKPGRPDPETGGATRVLRGYVLAWAVRQNPTTQQWEEIRWNHLKGDAVVVNYAQGSAFEYNAFAFQAHLGANGAFLPTPGELSLDGLEYDMPFDELLLDFYASGSSVFSRGIEGQPNSTTVSVDTDLTLLPVSVDLRQDNTGPVTTKVEVEIWNEFETKFSGTRRCITCWDQTLLSNYVRSVAIPNHFLRSNLRTDKGKARINGVASTECDDINEPFFDNDSVNASLLGMATKVLSFNGSDLDTTGLNLVGMGEQAGLIQYDIAGQGDEFATSTSGRAPRGARSGATQPKVRAFDAIPVDPHSAE
jgi:hypothetical protein